MTHLFLSLFSPDSFIALSYCSILFFLIYLVQKRRDLIFNWIFLLFSFFLIANSITFLLEMITNWYPLYEFEGLIKVFKAIFSMATAISLWLFLPKMIGPSDYHELDQKNKELQTLISQLHLSSESKLHQVVEAAPNGLLMVNQSGEIVLCNAEIESLFGYQREELLGKKIEMLIPEKYRLKHPHHRNSYLLKAETRQMGAGRDLTGLRKDGTEVPLEIGLNPVQTEDGHFVLASIFDITERKKTASELFAAKEAAESANFAKSTFLANMSHEIRTPLGAIMGFADLVIDEQVRPSEKVNFVAAIKRNGELLSNIINDILDLSKIEAGKMKILFQRTV